MNREIIHVQIGQCGNQTGNTFWSRITKEHKLNKHGKYENDQKCNNNQSQPLIDRIKVYYNEAGTMRFVPRACLLDLEPGIIDVIKTSPMGSLLKPDNMCFGASSYGSSNKSPIKMIHTEGAELIDEFMYIIRREAEHCDSLQGFQMTHS